MLVLVWRPCLREYRMWERCASLASRLSSGRGAAAWALSRADRRRQAFTSAMGSARALQGEGCICSCRCGLLHRRAMGRICGRSGQVCAPGEALQPQLDATRCSATEAHRSIAASVVGLRIPSLMFRDRCGRRVIGLCGAWALFYPARICLGHKLVASADSATGRAPMAEVGAKV